VGAPGGDAMTALIEVKVADLAGEPLNWAVGTAEGLNMFVAPTVYGVPARAFVNRLRGETGNAGNGGAGCKCMAARKRRRLSRV